MSKFFISEVPTLWKFEDRSHEETERQQRCKAWNQAKNMCKLKEKNKAAFYLPAKERVFPAASTILPEERELVVDSAASVHIVSKRDLNSAALETMRTSRSPMTVMTANGEVQTMSSNWTSSSKLCFLKKLPQCFPWGMSVRIMGMTTTGPAVKNHTSPKMGRKWIAIYQAVYHSFVVPGLSASSSSTTPSPTSPSSSSQDSVFDVSRYTENPALERSGSTSKELRGNPLHKSKETENKNKNGESEEVQRDISHELHDWLKEFRENLVDVEQGSQYTSKSSHELPTEPRKSGTGFG